MTRLAIFSIAMIALFFIINESDNLNPAKVKIAAIIVSGAIAAASTIALLVLLVIEVARSMGVCP